MRREVKSEKEYHHNTGEALYSDQEKENLIPPDKKPKMEDNEATMKKSTTVSPLPQDSFSTEVELQVAQVGEVSESVAIPAALAVQTISLSHLVKHEVAIPRDYQGYIPLAQHTPSSNPAREFAFELDPF